MKRALISQRQQRDRFGVPIDVLESSYIRYFERMGYIVIPVPNFTKTLSDYLHLDISLVILTGGGSVASRYFTIDNNEVESPERDDIEFQLYHFATNHNIPLLAICRGMQYVNGILGGNMSHLTKLHVLRPIGQDHPILFCNKKVLVNNFHNDGIYVHNLASSLTPIGIDEENNIVEIYSSVQHRILGVQFHPERLITDDDSRYIIDELIKSFIR